MAGKRRAGRKPSEKMHNGSDSGDNNDGSAAESDGYVGEARQISAQEEADLSSALIAKLLAEDSGMGGHYRSYYDDYSNGAACGDAFDEGMSGSEADDDWDPNRKRQRAPRPGRTRKNQQHPQHQQQQQCARNAGTADDSMEHSSSDLSEEEESRKKPRRARKQVATPKKDRPPPPPVAPGQYRSGAYTDEEEIKFNEGLELYGRAWGDISAHVVTRDAKSIRSHAQKYFIKLFRDKLPLPAKVLESGDGYTLSGKPLDPNSAAARPYLQHVMQLDPPAPRAPKPEAKPKPSADSSANEGAGPEGDALDGGSALERAAEPTASSDVAPGSAADASTARPDVSETPTASESGPAETEVARSPVRTEYAMSRPQRNHAKPLALRYDDPHQMVRCTPFQGQPLSGAAGCQPFRLVVHTNAQVQMDFHAHLMLSEVIGLLGGHWDAQGKVLTVTRAFPCEALESEDAHTNVEMDPGSELVVRHQIMDAGLRVVGWYHSHPTFRPDPSIIDIENQTAYQTLFRDSSSSEEPFVGAIVGPYDPQLPGPVSAINWFYVGRSAIDRGHPKRLAIETARDMAMPEAQQSTLLELLDSAGTLRNHAIMDEVWRPSSTELRSLKMAVSLAHRMPWLKGAAKGAAVCKESADDKSDPTTPAAHALADVPEAQSETEAVLADTASDCTASSALVAGAETGDSKVDGAEFEKRIPPMCLLAGQCAAQDPFLSALSRRFGAGVFKSGPSGELADPLGLERVYAAYFMQWLGTGTD
ncbi:hypothetical protein GGI07_003348 [Coemansia sp. Benny D115]|nr:hypothetical protein GGI07_003348 [Coemansia sp. Benny D115]